jgi:hypothetical protein
MKIISTLFKQVENNKKMIELLFMNFEENPNEFDENLKRFKTKNSIYNKNPITKNINENKPNRNKKLCSEIYMNGKKKIYSSTITNTQINNLNMSNKNLVNNTQKRKSFELNTTKNNFILNDNNKKNNENNKNIGLSLKINLTNNTANVNNITNKKKIFPYKYYFFSIFIIDVNKIKGNSFFSSQFSKIYLFLCQLFDITTYFLLNREFNALKAMYNENNVNINLLETNRKENNYIKSNFNEINDCSLNNKSNI